MDAHAPLRLRCPADSPREADRHLAIDVRLPLSIEAVAALAERIPRCPCGQEIGIDTRTPEGPREDRIAALETANASLSDEVAQRRRERDEAMRARDALAQLREMDAARITALETALREVLPYLADCQDGEVMCARCGSAYGYCRVAVEDMPHTASCEIGRAMHVLRGGAR